MEDEIYLDPSAPPPAPTRRPSGYRQRLGWALGLLLIIGIAVVVQQNRHRSDSATSTAPGSTIAAALRPWPHGRGVCGTELELPLVSSARTKTATGASVLVTGPRPGLADVDLGTIKPIRALRLQSDQYVSQLIAGTGSTYYSLVRSCPNRTVGMVVRTSASGQHDVLADGIGFYGLLDNGQGGVWGERHLARPEAAISSTLVRLDEPAAPVTLPAGLNPIGLVGNQVVATGVPLPATPAESPLYLFDLTVRRQHLIGNSFSVSVSNGVAIWNSTACSASGPCTLHTFDVATAAETVRDYNLPMTANLNDAVLSPDRGRLAYLQLHDTADGIYRSAAAQPAPAGLVVLDLGTGVATAVPNLELPPGTAPAELDFTRDGGTLLIGLNGADATMLLSWRSGMSMPVLSPAG